MTTLKEAIQYRIHQTSGQIRALKDSAMTPKKANAAGVVHLDHINPKHPAWAQYSSLKQQVSMLLTMRIILKHFGDEVKGKESLRKAIRKGFFQKHTPKDLVARNGLIIEAHRELAQLERDLALNPSRFEEAGKYADQRRQEAKERKEMANASA